MAKKRLPTDRAPGRPGPELSDTDHEFILRNEKANKDQAKEAIARAMVNPDLTREEVKLLVRQHRGRLARPDSRGWDAHAIGADLRRRRTRAGLATRPRYAKSLAPAGHLAPLTFDEW